MLPVAVDMKKENWEKNNLIGKTLKDILTGYLLKMRHKLRISQ